MTKAELTVNPATVEAGLLVRPGDGGWQCRRRTGAWQTSAGGTLLFRDGGVEYRRTGWIVRLQPAPLNPLAER